MVLLRPLPVPMLVTALPGTDDTDSPVLSFLATGLGVWAGAAILALGLVLFACFAVASSLAAIGAWWISRRADRAADGEVLEAPSAADPLVLLAMIGESDPAGAAGR